MHFKYKFSRHEAEGFSLQFSDAILEEHFGKRIDKRGWKQCREVNVSYDEESGVSVAKLGATKVMCFMEAEISAPRKSSKPGAGSIQFSLEITPMAHPASGESALDAEADECLTLLETLYRDTSCVDFDTLCIEINQYVFDIKCSIKVLDYDGGLFDCASLAVTTALMGFKRNDATHNAVTKKLIIHSASEKPMVPLTMIHKPATVTFGFVSSISEPLIDPTDAESVCIDGYLVIGANRRGEICLIYQYGKLSTKPEMVTKCTQMVVPYVKSAVDKMSQAVYGKVVQ